MNKLSPLLSLMLTHDKLPRFHSLFARPLNFTVLISQADESISTHPINHWFTYSSLFISNGIKSRGQKSPSYNLITKPNTITSCYILYCFVRSMCPLFTITKHISCFPYQSLNLRQLKYWNPFSQMKWIIFVRQGWTDFYAHTAC